MLKRSTLAVLLVSLPLVLVTCLPILPAFGEVSPTVITPLGYCIELSKIDYRNDGISTWQYKVWSCESPVHDLSNWGVQLCENHEVLAVSDSRCEVIDPDPHFGFRALKCDIAVDKNDTVGMTIWFELNGHYPVSWVQLGGKAGQDLFPPPQVLVEGPDCEETPTVVKLSSFSAGNPLANRDRPTSIYLWLVLAVVTLGLFAYCIYLAKNWYLR